MVLMSQQATDAADMELASGLLGHVLENGFRIGLSPLERNLLVTEL